MNDNMQTNMLIYDVHGKICPGGMTAENCKLRQKLAQMEHDLHIGYTVMENGNLLAPKWFATDNDVNDTHFNLEQTRQDICNACYRENRKKELAEPDNAPEKPKIQTVIYGYMQCGVNCPAGMTKGTCPLRKEMAQTDERYNIGYKELGEKTLLFPSKHYDVKSNAFHDVSARRSEICTKCFEQNRQNVR